MSLMRIRHIEIHYRELIFLGPRQSNESDDGVVLSGNPILMSHADDIEFNALRRYC